MQDPGEATGGRTGVEEGEDGQQRPRASNFQASSQSSAAEGDQDEVPRESGPQDASSQSVPGRSRPGSPVGLGVAAEEAAVVPQDELPTLLPGPSGDVATTASRLLEFRWTTDDTSLFQISINSFLDQLSVVMRNIRHFQFVAVVKRGRGRIHHT
ncbi:L antigen family member 3-like [Microtus ochrogaster]|uniref:L antigen family member 3-like n=1 Tax=Microtus ochrogaster TaxID=79684 RepID=A0A8J6GUD7_MICOH|nr:L antigen family member 3-like [Microtus ochrogaster]